MNITMIMDVSYFKEIVQKTKIEKYQLHITKIWCKNASKIRFYFYYFTNALEKFVYITVYVLKEKERFKF